MEMFFGGPEQLIAAARNVYELVHNIADRRKREHALLRLLYTELGHNLAVLETLRLEGDDAPASNNADYLPVGRGLSFGAHLAVFTEGLLDDERVAERDAQGNVVMVRMLTDDLTGIPVDDVSTMSMSMALSRVCRKVGVLGSVAGMQLSDAVSRDLRFGVRLRNIFSYERGLFSQLGHHRAIEGIRD